MFEMYFGFHLEDMNLNSINYLHRGSPKVWYFVPASEGEKLEKIANEFGKAVNSTCNNFLRHKALLIPPLVLKEQGMRFSWVVQNPDEYIVSFSAGYHSGFNCGWNEAQSINFGTERWLKFFPEFKHCDCRDENANTVKKILTDVYCQEEGKLQKRKNSFVCDICQKTFTLKNALSRHMKSSHMSKVRRFTCVLCMTNFTTKYGCEDHIKNCHNTQPDETKVKEILMANTTLRKTKSRTLREALACDECKIVIHGKDVLKRHKQRKHSKEIR